MRCWSDVWRWLCLVPESSYFVLNYCEALLCVSQLKDQRLKQSREQNPPPSAFASQLQQLQPENSRRRSVRVKRQRHLQAAELLPSSAQDALHAVVPVGQPVGQVDVGQVEDRRGQRVRALREEETRGQVQRSEALWELCYHRIIISASVEPVPSHCRGSVI